MTQFKEHCSVLRAQKGPQRLLMNSHVFTGFLSVPDAINWAHSNELSEIYRAFSLFLSVQSGAGLQSVRPHFASTLQPVTFLSDKSWRHRRHCLVSLSTCVFAALGGQSIGYYAWEASFEEYR